MCDVPSLPFLKSICAGQCGRLPRNLAPLVQLTAYQRSDRIWSCRGRSAASISGNNLRAL